MNDELAARRAAEQKLVDERLIRPLLELSRSGDSSEVVESRFRSLMTSYVPVEQYVLTENEWLECSDDHELAWFEHPNLKPERFEPLAIVWCERNRALLGQSAQDPNPLAKFDAYLRWRKGDGLHPREIYGSIISTPLGHSWNGRDEATDAVHYLLEGKAIRAAVFAGNAASMYSRPDRLLRLNIDDRKADAVWKEFLAQYRDVAGNPFQPIDFNPTWRTETAIALARSMSESGSFDRMTILADALEEAGCDVEAVLTHCRNPDQVHVRGCWVVDHIWGRA